MDHPDCPTDVLDAIMDTPTVCLLTYLLSRDGGYDWQTTRRNLRTDLSHIVVDVLTMAREKCIDLTGVPGQRPTPVGQWTGAQRGGT